jgi:uncharacterized repeat protein (TIGR01451 family)
MPTLRVPPLLPTTALVLALVITARPANAVQTRLIPIVANDVVYCPQDGMLYVSVAGLAPLYANTITRVNPVSGAIGPSVPIGSEPRKLALSSDGTALWVGLDGAGAIRKVDLGSLTAGPQFSLGSDPFLGPYFVEDMEVIPGAPNSVVVALRNQGFSPRHMGVAAYDNGVRRPTMTPGHTGSNIIVFSSSPTRLYGQNIETTEFGFRRMDVTPSGVTVVDATQNLLQGFGGDIAFENGRVYSTGGEVINAEARVLLGRFPFPQDTYGSAMAPDGNLAYFAMNTYFGYGQVRIESFNTTTFTPVLDYALPGATGTPTVLHRWGASGLVMRTDNGSLLLIDDIQSPPTCDILLYKTDDFDPVSVNDDIYYRIRVQNRGTAPAENVTVRDPVPALTSFVYASHPRGFCYDSSGTIVCTSYSSVAAGDSFEIFVNLRALAAGTVLNTATATTTTVDPEPGNNVASQTTEIREPGFNAADVYLSVTAAVPGQIVEGESIDIPILYGNQGPGAATGTQFYASVYGGGLAEVEVLSGLGNCTMNFYGTIACSLGTVPAGSSAAATIRVRPLSSGYFSINFSIFAHEQDSNFFNNFYSASLLVQPSAPRLLDSLAAAVSLLDLNKGQEKNLTRQLDLAKAALAARDTAQACNELVDFQGWLSRWTGRHLDLDEAYALSVRCRMIQQLLSCFGPPNPPDSTRAASTHGRNRISEPNLGVFTPTSTTSEAAVPREVELRTGSMETQGGVAMVGMPAAGNARLELLDVQGRVVRTLFDGSLPAGQHVVHWDPQGVPSGIYFCRLVAMDRQKVAKVAVAR